MRPGNTMPEFLRIRSEIPGWSEPGYCLVDEKPQLQDYLFLKQAHQYYMYLCMLVTGAKNKAEPLVSVDPTTITACNQRGYFPVTICDTILRQFKTVTNTLKEFKYSSFVLANEYNLQRAAIKPRALLLSLWIRQKKLHAHAHFGISSIQPMLPYEIAGIVTTCTQVSHVVEMPLESLVWSFQNLYCESVAERPYGYPIIEQEFQAVVPSYSNALEMLRLERLLRDTPAMRPRSDRPLSAIERTVLDRLQEDYSARIPARVSSSSDAEPA